MDHAEPDIFDLLDVSLREDSYTALIKAVIERGNESAQTCFHLLGDGLRRPHSVEVRFRQIFPTGTGPGITLRSADRPDLLLVGTGPGELPLWILIEAKIESGEGDHQLARYRDLCGAAKHAGCIGDYRLYYLTLLPRRPSIPEFTNLTYRELVVRLADVTEAVKEDTFQVAWRGFCTRLAELESLRPPENAALLPWLATEQRFTTRGVRAAAFARTLLCSPWEADGWFGSWRRHAQFLFVAWAPGWRGAFYGGDSPARLVDCLNIHLELGIPADYAGASVRLALHFETNPYMPKRVLTRLAGKEPGEFAAMRETARHTLESRLPSGWHSSRHALQLAWTPLALTAETKLIEFRRTLSDRAEQIKPVLDRFIATELAEFLARDRSL